LKPILERYNILLIADEVQMAFYRTGTMWSFENYGVSPDIIVFGKAITNGFYPLSGVWARNPILDKENWPSSSAQATYGGSPLGCALANATY
jgi:4-aminobutyrate aminotransferase-like enzyme